MQAEWRALDNMQVEWRAFDFYRVGPVGRNTISPSFKVLPSRPVKRPSAKPCVGSKLLPVAAERREDISNLIHKFGFEMPRCSACFRAERPHCVVSEGKQRCDFCVSKKYFNCDFGGVSSQSFARVSREKDRIDEQKEQAEADLQDALARLQRLRCQEKHLREKAAEMVRRGCG
ncbi:hypothetical protein FPOA_16820 [Fusarium poae]|uniref:Uncharacterized protein n=1 Tax=Fusarium poae TaxID=36050 RepID=A0A1B8AZR5_FUSPO|nr:hypothetical protein FPOA_28286 [Fusarium poae]OBS15694.1 hypothetical protein FPOA_28178 [Fusarium poae]OBS15826.1 hypothetical protein FPOA_28060 [Fusarium poae]OBS15874.1 hypothetical protein FPOA_28001 [Fusarium poae]OBS16686.1 hypothetical protein FPOA_27209 [Fusarium poae]